MAHTVSILFFVTMLVGAVGLVAAMLTNEWSRIVSILSGRSLATARVASPPMRVRLRSWDRPEPRLTSLQRHAVAA